LVGDCPLRSTALLTRAKWKYRAIHGVGDHQVGIWSNNVEIKVG